MWRAASLSEDEGQRTLWGCDWGSLAKLGRTVSREKWKAEADGERVGGEEVCGRREQVQELRGKPLRDVCREAGGLESLGGEGAGGDCGKEAESWGEAAGWTFARSKSRDGERQGGSCDGVGGHHPQPCVCLLRPRCFTHVHFHSS